jgi:outer membrane protein TolC
MRTLLLLAVSVLALAGCSKSSEPLSMDEQIETLDKDLASVFADQEPLDHPLSLHEAMARGILYNVDHRVTMMEEIIAKGEVNLALLDVLPSLDAKAQYISRDSEQAISARNKATGAQSLPPSVFEEKDHTTTSLTVGYDVLDAGLAIVQANTESDKMRIAEEHRRKAVHSIISDVRSAFWRAASAQILTSRIEELIVRGKAETVRLEALSAKGSGTAEDMIRAQQEVRLLEAMQQLTTLKAQLATAKIELAALINLPPRANYQLSVDESQIFDGESVPDLKLDPESLELVSLMIRPEMREEILMQRVASREIRRTALSAMPGLNALFGYYSDNNDFLSQNDWTGYSLSLTSNLVNLFTLPVRIEQAENKAKLAEMRRRALVVAVMSQVNIARLRMSLAEERFDIVRRLASVSSRMRGMVSSSSYAQDPAQQLEMEMQAALNRARLHMAYAEYQNAYAVLLNAVGMDPLPPETNVQNVAQLADVIADRTDHIQPQIFDKLLSYLKEKGLHAEDSLKESPVPVQVSTSAATPVAVEDKKAL